MSTQRPRRTQEQRRAETIGRLVAATIDAIAELGYAGATTREICARSGASQGGMFRHFASRQELIVTAVFRLYEESLDWLGTFGGKLATASTAAEFAAVLAWIREFLARPRTMVFLEVMVAARYDQELRERLRPVLDGQLEAIRAIGMTSPVIAAMGDDDQLAYIELVQHDLWLEALWSAVLTDEPVDDRKLVALADLGIALGARSR